MGMKAIQIGLTPDERIQAIKDYLSDNPDITNIVYFGADNAAPLQIPSSQTEYYRYSDAILYVHFYHLLETINTHYLLVFDGMLRTLKRGDLTYNCCVHYANQTPHVLAFQHFPMVQDPEDFMILVDLVTRNRYRKEALSSEYIKMAEIHPVRVNLSARRLVPTPKQIDAYSKKKNSLFDSIGQRDPNTIPRNLHIWAGSEVKKAAIRADETNIARNSRFKKPYVYTYDRFIKSQSYTILDFPVRVMQFTDFLEKSGASDLTFLHSGLPVDDVYFDRYSSIFKTMEDVFYDKTDLSK